MRSEYAPLAVAALALLVVLIASFMCVQLYRLRKPAPSPAPLGWPEGPGAVSWDSRRPPFGRGPGGRETRPNGETFLGHFYYAPACGTGRADARAACHGVTAGAMPSIEVGGDRGNGLCPGLLGVPP